MKQAGKLLTGIHEHGVNGQPGLF
ncbi:MAG: hypothetical protein AWT59_2288 [Candidatus Gallionella acididurans]|uniref:Uncharacterized protein n=1 Tax=Candidatus Gallionella acididurans TaxID=1796491 RepID=A0A139BRK0_9PROT|nr:MAG: hypothetical protein AWT59_2288 [Candidatus Gallionella acididurans]